MKQDRFENPFPFFAEAADAASRFVEAQRELLMVSTELRARRAAHRAVYLAVTLIFVNIAATLGLFWTSMGLHEAGWSSWVIALLALVLFGAIAGVTAYLGIQSGKAPGKVPIQPFQRQTNELCKPGE